MVSNLLKKIEAFVLAYGIIAISVICIANVFCRNVLQMSLSFAEEACQILIIWITFLGISYGAREGRHIRMSALYDQLSTQNRRRLMALSTGLTSVMMFVLTYYSIRYIQTVKQIGMHSPALDIPFYLIYLAVPVGLTLSGLQYGLTALRNLSGQEVYVSAAIREETFFAQGAIEGQAESVEAQTEPIEAQTEPVEAGSSAQEAEDKSAGPQGGVS